MNSMKKTIYNTVSSVSVPEFQREDIEKLHSVRKRRLQKVIAFSVVLFLVIVIGLCAGTGAAASAVKNTLVRHKGGWSVSSEDVDVIVDEETGNTEYIYQVDDDEAVVSTDEANDSTNVAETSSDGEMVFETSDEGVDLADSDVNLPAKTYENVTYPSIEDLQADTGMNVVRMTGLEDRADSYNVRLETADFAGYYMDVFYEMGDDKTISFGIDYYETEGYGKSMTVTNTVREDAYIGSDGTEYALIFNSAGNIYAGFTVDNYIFDGRFCGYTQEEVEECLENLGLEIP